LAAENHILKSQIKGRSTPTERLNISLHESDNRIYECVAAG
jgi:hypothetical protein